MAQVVGDALKPVYAGHEFRAPNGFVGRSLGCEFGQREGIAVLVGGRGGLQHFQVARVLLRAPLQAFVADILLARPVDIAQLDGCALHIFGVGLAELSAVP